jgi:hypothetical protein
VRALGAADAERRALEVEKGALLDLLGAPAPLRPPPRVSRRAQRAHTHTHTKPLTHATHAHRTAPTHTRRRKGRGAGGAAGRSGGRQGGVPGASGHATGQAADAQRAGGGAAGEAVATQKKIFFLFSAVGVLRPRLRRQPGRAAHYPVNGTVNARSNDRVFARASSWRTGAR